MDKFHSAPSGFGATSLAAQSWDLLWPEGIFCCFCHFQPLSNLGIFTEETAGKIAQEVQTNSTGNSSLQEQRVRKGDHGELLPPPKGTGCSAAQKSTPMVFSRDHKQNFQK